MRQRAAWQPQRSPIPIRPSQVRERRGPPVQQVEHRSSAGGQASEQVQSELSQVGESVDEPFRTSHIVDEDHVTEDTLGTAALGATATSASSRVAPPQLDVALWMLDECETPKRSRSIILDTSKRLGFGETPSKKMPALTPPVHMSMAPLEVAIAPTPCIGVSDPTADDSWQYRASSPTDRTNAQSPVGCKLERRLFAPEAPQSTLASVHGIEKQEQQTTVQAEADAARQRRISRLSPRRRLQCRGLGRSS